MPEIILTEGNGTLDEIYGNFQAPIVEHIENLVEGWQEKSIAPLIFREKKIETFAGGYTSTTAMDDFLPVGENGAHPSNGFQSGYSKVIPDMTWKSQFGVSQEMVEDQQLGEALDKATRFTNAYYRTKERFCANLLGSAAAGKSNIALNGKEFDITAADGLTMFHKEHKGKVSGHKLCNKFADAFSGAAWGEMITAYQNIEGENGEVLGLSPDTLVIPNDNAMKNEAYAWINSHNTPGNGNNDANPLYGNQRVIVWPYLNQFIGSIKPWFVMDSKFNEEAAGAIFQNRLDLVIRSVLGENDENLWKGRARFSGGFVDWRSIFGGGLTGGASL